MLKSFIVNVTDPFIISFKYCELVENKLRVSICVPILEFCSCVNQFSFVYGKGKTYFIYQTFNVHNYSSSSFCSLLLITVL